jgi:hypothetical protein
MDGYLKAGAFGLFAAGLVGVAMGTADFLDARVSFCDASTNPCRQRVLPASSQIPTSASFVQYLPGAAGQKLFGASLAVVGFSGCMMLSRFGASTEPLKQRFQAIAEADSIRRYRQRIDADFEAYTTQELTRA